MRFIRRGMLQPLLLMIGQSAARDTHDEFSEEASARLRSAACTGAFGGRGTTRPPVAEDVFAGGFRALLHTSAKSNASSGPPIDTAKYGCGPVQHISGASTGEHPRFENLAFPTIFKVASTSLRKQVLPELANCGAGKGCSYTPHHRMGACEQGCPRDSNGQKQTKFDAKQYRNCKPGAGMEEKSSTAMLTLVRDPLSKALSAFLEIVHEPALRNGWKCFRSCECSKRDARKSSCLNGTVHTPSKTKQDFALFMLDVGQGFRNCHMYSQSLFLLSQPKATLSKFGQVEHGQEAWDAFMRTVGVSKHINFGKSNAKSHEHTNVTEFTSTFHDRHWDIFCAYYRQDYLCIPGYSAPAECEQRWSSLATFYDRS